MGRSEAPSSRPPRNNHAADQRDTAEEAAVRRAAGWQRLEDDAGRSTRAPDQRAPAAANRAVACE